MLIARRAFQRGFTFPKFNRITVYFCKSSLSRRTFPRMKIRTRAIFVRGLFAISQIYSRFARAITRFQRNFSVNSA